MTKDILDEILRTVIPRVDEVEGMTEELHQMTVDTAKAQINKHYIKRSEVLKIIDTPTDLFFKKEIPVFNGMAEYMNFVAEIRSNLRTELRASITKEEA
jgi:hypothetical protein